MTFSSVLAWIIIVAAFLAALFILALICVLFYKGFRSIFRRLEIRSKEA